MNSEKAVSTYKIVRLTAKNITDVERLYVAVYNRQPRAGFFYKKYDTAFTGIEHVGYLAYDNELPVAFHAAIPCFLSVDTMKVLATQSADAMTHPDYRNKGLFVELALMTFQLCRELNVKLLFGFPNQNSLHGFVNKLGCQQTETMERFVINTHLPKWKRALKKLPLVKSVHNSVHQRILARYQLDPKGITSSAVRDGYWGLCRNSDFLNYKTYNDTRVIHINRAILWIKTDGILLIGDMKVAMDDFDDTINELKKLAAKLGLKEIHFHLSKGTMLHSLFAMRFSAINSFTVIFKSFDNEIDVNKIKFTSADIDIF